MEPEQETFELWPVFDAFVKVVARRANTRYFHKRETTDKHVTLMDPFVICAQIDKSEAMDKAPFETLYVYHNGHRYPITDPNLRVALQQLPEESLRILIFKFWHAYKEDEIAERMKLSIRSCYTKRKRALKQLREIMEEEHEET